MSSDSYIQSLLVTNHLREPVLRVAIEVLQLPWGSHGLDAGCGIGLQALLLAKAVGPTGHVTGLDIDPQFVSYAEALRDGAGLEACISFRQGDVRQLPFNDDSFGWAWSVDCVGYAPLEPLPLVQELARVVRLGGSVALLAWSSQMLLPGYPRLEARLNATSAGIAPFAEGRNPQEHFPRALGWFRDAGLEEVTAHTFTGDAQAPLNDELRAALTELLQMRWPKVERELAPEDRAAYERLCQPDSPHYILNQPDYYAFFTYTMFRGRVAGSAGL